MESTEWEVPDRHSQKSAESKTPRSPFDAKGAGKTPLKKARSKKVQDESPLGESPSEESVRQDPEMLALMGALVELAPALEPGQAASSSDEWREPAAYLTPPEQSSGSSSTRLSSAVGGCMDALLNTATLAAKASAAWHKAAGESAIRHTRGLYYKEGTEGQAGVLYVYVDSPVFIYEFTTDHELYEQRMAYLGWSVDHIEFRLSRYPATPGAWGESVPQKPQRLEACQPLSAEQEQWCEHLVESLPDDLAEAAYKALRTTLQRNMS